LEGTIHVWDAESGTGVVTMNPRAGPVWEVGFASDQRLVSVLDDGTLVVWDVDTGERVATAHLKEEGYHGLAVDSAGSIAATAQDRIVVWDLETLEQIVVINRLASTVAFSPNGRLLAAVLGSEVALFDTETGLQVGAELVGHRQQVVALAFDPKGEWLASGGSDNRILLWNVAEQTLIGTAMTGHGDSVTGLAFAGDGSVLVSASRDGTLRFWDVALDGIADRVCREFLLDVVEGEWRSVMGDDVPFEPACFGGSFQDR
jgi:WD40 repeat protein